MDGAFDRDTGMAMLQTLCSSKKKVYVRCRGILMGDPRGPDLLRRYGNPILPWLGFEVAESLGMGGTRVMP